MEMISDRIPGDAMEMPLMAMSCFVLIRFGILEILQQWVVDRRFSLGSPQASAERGN